MTKDELEKENKRLEGENQELRMQFEGAKEELFSALRLVTPYLVAELNDLRETNRKG